MTRQLIDRLRPGHAGTQGSVLRLRNFRLLWLGQGASSLGDQLALVALPWLVLRLTGDPLVLAGVLAAGGIPRAVTMLLGGAIADHFSPRTVMVASDVLRCLLMAGLALLVLVGDVQVWMVYVLAFAFGLVDGFFMPASGAMIPALVPAKDLAASNSLYHGTAQLLSFVGPTLAGGLIALLAQASATGSGVTGIGWLLIVDAATFVASILTLLAMRLPASTATPAGAGATGAGISRTVATILGSIGSGLAYVWQDRQLRLLFSMMAIANFLWIGPIAVGLPVLANNRLAEGAAAFGILVGGYGAGNLLGYALAGARPVRRRLGLAFAALYVVDGLLIAAFAFVTSTWLAALVSLLIGVGSGYLTILLMTWRQVRTPAHLQGRVLSLIMLASLGVAPLSQALAGALIKISLSGVYLGVAALTLLFAVVVCSTRELRTLEL